MKIVVSHVYSLKNKGDAALLSVLLSDIRKVYVNAEITVLAMDAEGIKENFKDVEVHNSFMHYASERYQNPILKAVYGVYLIGATMSWAILERYLNSGFPLPTSLKEVAMIYKEADLIIPVGGGYFRSKGGFTETAVLLFQVHPIFFSSVLNKITVGYSQSVGPFANSFQEFLARSAIRKMSGIIVREEISKDLLIGWNIKNIFLSVDSGFSFSSDINYDLKTVLNIGPDKVVIGITVRDWLPAMKQKMYEKVIADFADYVIGKYNAFVVFVPQVTVDNHSDDDRLCSQRVFDLMNNKNNAKVLAENYDLHYIKSIYGSFDYLVGTRFHSVIFALTSFVPSIAIGYEYKTLGIMSDLNLKNWVLDIDSLALNDLRDVFDRLISDRNSYVHTLKEILPKYISRSEKNIYFVQEVFDRSQSKNI